MMKLTVLTASICLVLTLTRIADAGPAAGTGGGVHGGGAQASAARAATPAQPNVRPKSLSDVLANGPYVTPQQGLFRRTSPWQGDYEKLHEKALMMQKSDGGTLSDAHRALLQAKLDALNAATRRH